MHPSIQFLADHYGVKLRDRSATDSFVFDGESIATHWHHQEWDDDCKKVLFRERMEMSDHDLLHEIGHFVAAAPEQRDLPEYGMMPIAHLYDYDASMLPADGVVDVPEMNIQEHMAQMLCVMWGNRYGLSIEFSEERIKPKTWDEYLMWKYLEVCQTGNETNWWTAMIRVRGMKGFESQNP